MVIWEISNVGDTFKFYEKKGDAARALSAYRKEEGTRKVGTGPDKVDIRNREDLIKLLKRVASNGAPPEQEDDDDGEENSYI